MSKRKHDETDEERRIRKAEKKAKKEAKLAKKAQEDGGSNGGATLNKLSKPKAAATSSSSTMIPTSLSSAGQAYLDKHQIKIEAAKQLEPLTAFSALKVHADISKALSRFKDPSPIQAASWPYLLSGQDAIGIAETGSGKTFAFGVPAVQNILQASTGANARKVISVLVVAPTRELALQTNEQLNILGESTGIKSACIYGGASKDGQRKELKKACVVVGTPGRINDMIDDGSLDLSKVQYLVLDEADRMLDTGFEQDIRKIIGTTQTEGRQTLMFSATWPESVRKLAASFMRNPVRITIGSQELSANVRVSQSVEVVEPRDKEFKLQSILKKHHSGKNSEDRILIFALYKKEAARVESNLRYKGHNVVGIHGDMSQAQRESALAQFKSGTAPLLVATDVAARGLDIPNVKMVINLTFPLTIEDYIHRIGRTGRGGQSGAALTLFTKEDKHHSGSLINVLKQANQPVPDDLLKFGTTTKPKVDIYGRRTDVDQEPMKAATKITFD
ncbi:RNA-dependent ATPase [Savitreella phatthalungensis]